MRRRLILGIGLLILTSGCLGRMGRIAVDLPVTRTVPGSDGGVVVPMLNPPDGKVIAREPPGRRVRELDAAMMRSGPVVALLHWTLFGVVIAF